MTPTDPKNRPTPGTAGTTPRAESVKICTSCGTKNTSESRFCGSCAAPLSETLAAPPEGDARTVRASTVELARGNRLAERYEIIEELGRGGMGKVFKVYDHKVSEVIALKLIRPEISVQDKAIERFKNELKFTRKIAHRNICRMFDLGEVDYVFYITMEFVAGEDLKRFIKRAGPLNAGKALTIAGQICDGLAEAHRIGAVHRDLKPQNIMIDAEGNAKIMDFGIARFTEMDRMTGSGVMIGTPEYMSPEQAELAEVDARSDLYSLGVVLYEMVTGRVPFEGPTPLSLAMKHKMETPKNVREWNAQVPASLAAVIARCLEKDPNKRYQTAAELKAALDEVERGLGTADRDVTGRAVKTKKVKIEKPREEKAGGRKAVPLIAALVLIAAAAGVYFLFLRPTPVVLPQGGSSAAVNPPASDKTPVPSESKPAEAEVKPPAEKKETVPLETKPAVQEAAKPVVPETKTETVKPPVSGEAGKPVETKSKVPPPAETKPPAVETKKVVETKPPAEKKPPVVETAKPETKTEEAKPKPALPEEKKTGPSGLNADKAAMFAAQSRTIEARGKAVAAGSTMESFFFQAADGVQQDAAVALAQNKSVDAECGFAVAEKLYALCVSESGDRARRRALLRHIDGLRSQALAAWKNVEGDPLFEEAKSRLAKGETFWSDDKIPDALKEYAAAAFDYEKIRWLADWQKKK